MIIGTINNEFTLLGKTISSLNKNITSSGIVKGLQQSFSISKNGLTKNDIGLLKEYASLMNSGMRERKAFSMTIAQGTESLKRQTIACKGDTDAMLKLANAEESTLLSTKDLSLGMKALSTAGNMLLFFAITKGIELAVNAIDNYIHRVEKAAEKTAEIQQKINDINSTYKSHADLVSDVAERYDELRKGVNSIDNSNISLSDEDYKEFLDINNQLIDALPELYGGLDQNNNIILRIGASAVSTAEYLQGLIDKERELSNIEIANEIDGLYKNVSIQIKDAQDKIADLETQLSDLNQTWENAETFNSGSILGLDRLEIGDDIELQNAVSRSIQQLRDELYKKFKDGKIDSYVYLGFMERFANIALYDNGTLFDGYVDMLSLNEDEKQRLQEILQEQTKGLMGELEDAIEDVKNNLSLSNQNADAIWEDFIPDLIAGMKSKANFKKLEDVGLGDFAVSIVQGLRYDVVSELKGTTYENDIYGYVRDAILIPIQTAVSVSFPATASSNF